MEMADQHIPVLLDEVLAFLEPERGGRYLDGTVGLAGHASAILKRGASELLGLDRDEQALSLAAQRLAPFGERVHLAHGLYADFPTYLASLGWERVQGVLIDIGVSSMQIDSAGRGFSFLHDGPLDMRMDGQSGPSAADLVNSASFVSLRDILARFGEEPNAARIARAIVEKRNERPIVTTKELAELVERSYPKKWRETARHHPATRTFQALRMAVNDELGQLERFLETVLAYLEPDGRLCVITFHSLEDRLVKKTMQRWSRGCLCPPYVDHCVCGHRPEVRILSKKPVQAQASELLRNSRARSAKLRAVARLI
ncbi:MAG: 16S rRNA (cytosine(1402)-N(4))-methyltransferase RsmH [Desulfovibrio sp.]|nr:16S rRNA (cytosine(1402)-N(4))-methyltransferase RsmH [Desulfovibrio sp.]